VDKGDTHNKSDFTLHQRGIKKTRQAL